jgi:hypothetical protein
LTAVVVVTCLEAALLLVERRHVGDHKARLLHRRLNPFHTAACVLENTTVIQRPGLSTRKYSLKQRRITCGISTDF